MTEIKSYHYKDLLNRLSQMQRAPYYATACQTLVQAEMAIVALEDELAGADKVIKSYEQLNPPWAVELRAALAQQGEPVAWMRPSVDGYDAAYRDASAVATSKATGATHWDDSGWVPLYLHAQPAREPMTSEQLLQLELSLRQYYDSDTYDLSLREFARAIEAHHGIKGATE